MPCIGGVLGWAARYLSMTAYEYNYLIPKYGSVKGNVEEIYWEGFLSTTSKIRFFQSINIELRKSPKSHLALKVNLMSFCLQVFHSSLSGQDRKK